MKPNETPQFSWSGLFLVTSFCFLAFSGLIKVINGSHLHSVLFTKIAIVSLILSGFTYANSLNKSEKKKKRRLTSSYSRRLINH